MCICVLFISDKIRSLCLHLFTSRRWCDIGAERDTSIVKTKQKDPDVLGYFLSVIKAFPTVLPSNQICSQVIGQ